ncbi:MAG: PilN domain-containing protein [Candidatus Levyibacteriota bacterium]|jgi:Tfp pilus assembly protein PilN
MAKFSASINLLENKNKTLDLIVSWALTVGRALVIIVELVALGAFLYRFSLDNQLQTLQGKIKQEQAIVAYQKDSESKYRNLQDRLALISSVSKDSAKSLKIFNDIIALAPNGFTFKIFNLTGGKVQVEGNANSVLALSNFIDNLKGYPLIDNVSLDRIQNDTANATITVGITATLKGQGGTNALSN